MLVRSLAIHGRGRCEQRQQHSAHQDRGPHADLPLLSGEEPVPAEFYSGACRARWRAV
jgi:hypothetical protein